MWWVLSAWCAPTDELPLPTLGGLFVQRELRAGHAVLRVPPYHYGGNVPAGYHPNVHASGTFALGAPVFHATLALHAEVARYRFTPANNTFPSPSPASYTDVRVEPRAGFRVGVPSIGAFLGAELGYAASRIAGPVAAATLGWSMPGDGLRPVFAIEARMGICTIAMSFPSHSYCPGAPGLLASAGARWGRPSTPDAEVHR